MSVSTVSFSTAGLVRTLGGVDVPAAGPWEIGGGQRLGLAAGGLRKRFLSAQVDRGTLVVTDDLLDSSLDFSVLVGETNLRVDFSTRVTRLLSVDSWQADGTSRIAGCVRPVTLRLRYNGVFRQRGRPASLWLAVQGTHGLPELGVFVGARRAGRLSIAAELNLNP